MIRLHVLAVYMLALLSGGALIYISQKVYEKNSQVNALNRRIVAEQDAIRVLEAEWAYLSRPDRLEELAVKVLGWQSIRVEGVVGVERAEIVLHDFALQPDSKDVLTPRMISFRAPFPGVKPRFESVVMPEIVDFPVQEVGGAVVPSVKPASHVKRNESAVGGKPAGFEGLMKRLKALEES